MVVNHYDIVFPTALMCVVNAFVGPLILHNSDFHPMVAALLMMSVAVSCFALVLVSKHILAKRLKGRKRFAVKNTAIWAPGTLLLSYLVSGLIAAYATDSRIPDLGLLIVFFFISCAIVFIYYWKRYPNEVEK